MWTKRNWGPTQVGSGKFFSPYPSGPLMRQERLLSVGTDGGGYINLLCTNKDDLSLSRQVEKCKVLPLQEQQEETPQVQGGVYYDNAPSSAPPQRSRRHFRQPIDSCTQSSQPPRQWCQQPRGVGDAFMLLRS